MRAMSHFQPNIPLVTYVCAMGALLAILHSSAPWIQVTLALTVAALSAYHLQQS